MNYFEHHIGDYDKNTSHLTACEDGIYHRMIRRYLDKEVPLPVDIKEVQILVRARSRKERKAVETILPEFFVLQSDGWHDSRIDREIAVAQAAKAARVAIQSARRATQLQAMPPWVDRAHLRKIRDVYLWARRLAAETGVAHDVDHIVPLRSKVVCGLHVWWNLRAIPACENRIKSNRLTEAA